MYVCLLTVKYIYFLQNHACLDMFGYYKNNIMKYELYIYIHLQESKINS